MCTFFLPNPIFDMAPIRTVQRTRSQTLYAIANEKFAVLRRSKISYLNLSKLPVLKPCIRKSDKTKKQVSFIWFITVTVLKSVYEYFLAQFMLKFVMQTCFLPSIRLFTKMLQIREFVNSPFCGCCII